MKSGFHVVVVGAGMVGLTSAALFAMSAGKRDLRITVVDGGQSPDFDADADVGLRVSAISLGSAATLDRIGVWDTIRRTRACAYHGMRVWDARASVDGAETLVFDAADFAVPELGFIVENSLVRNALVERLGATDIALEFNAPIANVEAEREGYSVALEDGRSLAADLLVGADGSRSFVRTSAGIPTRSWRYPQSALVTHVSPEQPHRQIAWQRFLKDGPLALLPLADGRASIVWSTTPERVDDCLAMSDEELGNELSEASDWVLGKLVVSAPRAAFPLRAQHAVRYVQPGLALIGDSAHSVHPLAGQGANLGLADALSLADTVAEAIDGDEYPGDVPTLRRYERARRGANAAMLHFVDSLNRLFMLESGGVSMLRRTGMRLFNRSGPVRRRAVEVALGIRN